MSQPTCNYQDVIADYMKYMNLRKVAPMHNISHERVRQILLKNNIVIKKIKPKKFKLPIRKAYPVRCLQCKVYFGKDKHVTDLCLKCYRKKMYYQNHNYFLEYNRIRRFRPDVREKNKESCKKYYLKNKKRLGEYHKEYYLHHKDKNRIWGRQYYHRHKEHLSEYHKQRRIAAQLK